MIVAAAVKFHIEKTDEDVVLCGVRHGDVYKQLKALGFKPKQGYVELEQGFVNNRGQFLTREEALKEAEHNGQLKQVPIITELFSEDLW